MTMSPLMMVKEDILADSPLSNYPLVSHTRPSVAMDWLVPGIAPTGKWVEIPLIIIFTFQGEKVASERLYWDQASMLMQLGVLDPGGLPISGTHSVQKLRQLTKAGE